MSYLIKDNNHQLTINLSTNYQYKSNLVLNTYINDATGIHSPSYSATTTTDGVVFNIPFSDYEVGDEITKITVSTSSATNIWDTQEGVNILLNGDESLVKAVEDSVIAEIGESPCRHEQFSIKFDNTGDYTMQGFYVGDNFNSMATTDEYHFKVDTAQSQDGEYSLVFQNPNLSTLIWNDKTKVNFILTKNGSGVGGKTIEAVTPSTVATGETDSKGITGWMNVNYPVGTYQIGAYYVDGGHIVAKTNPYKTITIKKANAVVTWTTGVIAVNGTLDIFLKDQFGTPLSNAKLSVYVNGKLKSKTTNANGKVSFKLTSAQTYKFKVVYKGNSNINSNTTTFNKVVQ